MSEYHSFSLAQHLPPSSSNKNILKKDVKPPQQEHNFHHHSFNIQEFNHDRLLHLTDPSSVTLHSDPLTNDKAKTNYLDWPVPQHQTNVSSSSSFQNLDSLLNQHDSNNNNRQHQATADFHPIFDFLPFDESSHGLMLTNDGNHATNELNVMLKLLLSYVVCIYHLCVYIYIESKPSTTATASFVLV